MFDIKRLQLSSAALHLLAMALMLLDHIWGVGLLDGEWLTCLGRIALPIFAFLLVEGFFHTGNLRRYAGRLFLGALVSEIPFNLMMGDVFFYPYHQNIYFTLLLSLGCMWVIERAKKRGGWRYLLTAAAVSLGGTLLGTVLMLDYYGFGVLMVLAFYFLRGNTFLCRAGQLLAMLWINTELMQGYSYVVELFGREVWIPQQAFALLALLPIWLYRGKQGLHSKAFRYFCYGFYPGHILVLVLLVHLLP